MSIQSTYQLVDRLHGMFTPIHRQWVALAPSDSPLWEATGGLTAIRILERDIIAIGRFFLQADHISGNAEAALIAECIALLRERDESTAIRLKAETITEQLLADTTFRTELIRPDETIHAPVSWRIAQLLSKRASLSVTTLEAFRQIFNDFAMHFIVWDGNITHSETERLAQFDATFG